LNFLRIVRRQIISGLMTGDFGEKSCSQTDVGGLAEQDPPAARQFDNQRVCGRRGHLDFYEPCVGARPIRPRLRGDFANDMARTYQTGRIRLGGRF
jgi:hypothetical protein